MVYTGLDLYISLSYITITNDKCKIVGHKKLPSNGEGMAFLSEFGGRAVLLEKR